MFLLDLCAYFAVRIFIAVLNILPIKGRLFVLSTLLKTFTMAAPGYRRIAHINLKIAFPDSDAAWRDSVISGSFDSLARTVVDFARLHTLSADWIKQHVECPFLPRYTEIKRANPDCGVLIATGHLGSFELLAHSAPMFGYPLSFVVRNFKLNMLDRWWTSIRQSNGNQVIARKGAFKDITNSLKAGRDVALLFDQNVRKKYAVFVDWFGKPAATTRAIGLAALRCRCPVIVSSISHIRDDHYRIAAAECNFDDLYADHSLSHEEKVKIITQRVSDCFQEMIKADPAAWFWMHRRWKTTPDGMEELCYRD